MLQEVRFSFASFKGRSKVAVSLVDKTSKAICIDAGAGAVWLPNFVGNSTGGSLFHFVTTPTYCEYQIFGDWTVAKEKFLSLSLGGAVFPCRAVKDGKSAKSKKVQIRVMAAGRETFRTYLVPASQLVLREGATFVPGWCLLDELRDGETLVDGDNPAIRALLALIEQTKDAENANAIAADEKRRQERNEVFRECDRLMAEIEAARYALRPVIDKAIAYCKRKFNLEEAVEAGLIGSKRNGWPIFSEITNGSEIGNCLPEQRLSRLMGQAAECRKAEQFYQQVVTLGFKCEANRRLYPDEYR